jgi:hypothetical protein
MMAEADLASYEVLARAIADRTYTEFESDLIAVQIEAHRTITRIARDAIEICDSAEVFSGQIDDKQQRQKFLQETNVLVAGAIIGPLVEGVVLNTLRDEQLISGAYRSIWTRQAFLREDHMHTRKLPAADGGDERLVRLKVPNMTFDLQIFSHGRQRQVPVNVEVKKSASLNPSTLMPGIEVVSLRENGKPKEFALKVIEFAEGQIARLNGQPIAANQAAAQEFFYGEFGSLRRSNKTMTASPRRMNRFFSTWLSLSSSAANSSKLLERSVIPTAYAWHFPSANSRQ